MPSKMDKIFGHIEAKIGGAKSKLGYYENLNLIFISILIIDIMNNISLIKLIKIRCDEFFLS